MTRTEYANALRKAGFSVEPMWQGKTEDPEGPRFDLTCYSVHGPDGDFLTQMILRDHVGGIDVFFASANLMVSSDLEYLRSLNDMAEDTRHDRENTAARRERAKVSTFLPRDPLAHPMSGRVGAY
ncbi:MAG: hypothetical protein HLUCCA12_12020 [Rhodobacteraceae bacterium HLUCCA12]|nr:MAG: hypothetical protein HLUCCA12_12020 [Rhodobacteraceae bacterium HLUCCA12]